jgi:biphenyl-2,3-diol 1,2-dioxygenase
MTGISALGYIGCTVSDPAAWERLLVPLLGMERRADSPQDRTWYRIDSSHHRLTLHHAGTDRLEYIGWEVASEEGLHELAAGLRAAGTDVTRAPHSLCAERHVFAMYQCSGPDGVPLELFYGLREDARAFRPGRGMEGFNTGALGMGHVVLACADREAGVRWYCERLGFRLTDHIYWDGIEATFLHCNARHHSLALTNAVEGLKGGDLGHFMLETASLDDVGRAYDLVRGTGCPLALTLGRHTNDHMISFYVYSPSGWWIEYGWGARTVDDATWQPRFHDAPKIWGHEMLPPPAGKVKKL